MALKGQLDANGESGLWHNLQGDLRSAPSLLARLTLKLPQIACSDQISGQRRGRSCADAQCMGDIRPRDMAFGPHQLKHLLPQRRRRMVRVAQQRPAALCRRLRLCLCY